MGLEAKLDERLGHGLDVLLVLAVGPLDPLAVPLDGQGGVVRGLVHRLLQHAPDRAGRVLGGRVGVAGPQLDRAVGPGGRQAVGREDSVGAHPGAGGGGGCSTPSHDQPGGGAMPGHQQPGGFVNVVKPTAGHK